MRRSFVYYYYYLANNSGAGLKWSACKMGLWNGETGPGMGELQGRRVRN